MKKPTKVEFTPPKDATIPQQEDPSAEWDMVCSFRTKPDGTVCMTKFGDAAMPGYDSDKAERAEPKPDYGNVYKPMMSQQIAGGPPAGGQGESGY